MRIARHMHGVGSAATPASRERLVRLRLVVVGLSVGLWALLVMVIGGPTWAVVLGLVAGFLIVLLAFGLRD